MSEKDDTIRWLGPVRSNRALFGGGEDDDRGSPTREDGKAWYRQLCQRPCFHDEYLQAFNSPNTHLVDTGGKGVEQITATGVVAAGRAYELDCIIYASGFEVGTPYTRPAGCEVTGKWRASGTFDGLEFR